MKIYIDSDYKCHISNDGRMQEVETDFFNGKCQEFIEGYRFVPDGEVWVREDGVEFHGEMVSPWKDYAELISAQAEAVTADRDALLEDMAALIEEIYQEDLEVIG